jgi:hypothetical protein
MIDENIIEQFSDGIRMLMLCQRNKEGRDTNKTDRASTRKISKNKEEFYEILSEFKKLKEESSEPLRIYSCVNRRDLDKAIREFKREQLDADYYDKDSRNQFYFDIRNRWISCLMQPNCRTETFFLIDIDNVQGETTDISLVERHLERLKVEVVAKYLTKNGVHIITKPFNPNQFHSEFGEIKKDALLLLDF